MDLTEDEVQKILKLVDELDYGEIHLEIGELKLDLVKQRSSDGRPARDLPATSIARTAESKDRGSTTSTDEARATAVTETPVASASLVTAPVAGTFYRAPAPGAKAFVEVGQRVVATDPVCLIEVMKLFQSIPAGAAGTVVQVLVADATPVRQGQPLVAIEPENAK
jgi:acetyl-CoA carboxylase biotin carboxyl carrier protein